MALKFMLLGIIKDDPVSGYDLNKLFKHVVHYFWSADQSTIYRTLHRLHDEGLVYVEVVEQSENPDKKLYHITEAGRAALRAWLATPAPPEPDRAAWLGQLFFGDELLTGELIALLEARITRLDAELAELEARERDGRALDFASDPTVPRAWRVRALTLDYGIAWARFQIDWARRAIAAIHAGDAAGE